jgi:anionic cell wall polymer biosynthesis LytR-Cps2A-Psr (LCP) family protein
MSALLVVVLVTMVAAALVWQYGVWGRGGHGSAASSPAPTVEPGAELTGPLNLLLVGVDTRLDQPSWSPKADAVLILHVTEGHDRAYLFSLPRDLLVDVPAFEPAGFAGQQTKLTHAMSYGSRVPGSAVPDPAQGLELLTRTVSVVNLPGTWLMRGKPLVTYAWRALAGPGGGLREPPVEGGRAGVWPADG